MDIRNAGNGNDRADICFLYIYFIQAVEFVKLADFYFFHFVRFVVVDDNHFLVDLYRTVVHFSHADSAHVFIIVDSADENLGSGFRVAGGGGDIV